MAFSDVIYRGPKITEGTKAAIFLHGRGSTAQNILGLADKLFDTSVSCIAPQAKNHTWYPYSFLVDEKDNEPYLTSSVESIARLIDETSKHVTLDNIYLIGFSQGACLSLEVSARFARKYGGIIAFTGGLIGSSINEKKYQGKFEGTKIFIGNADKDPHVPLVRSQQSMELLEKLGARVNLKVYERNVHMVSEDEIESAKKYLEL